MAGTGERYSKMISGTLFLMCPPQGLCAESCLLIVPIVGARGGTLGLSSGLSEQKRSVFFPAVPVVGPCPSSLAVKRPLSGHISPRTQGLLSSWMSLSLPGRRGSRWLSSAYTNQPSFRMHTHTSNSLCMAWGPDPGLRLQSTLCSDRSALKQILPHPGHPEGF